MGKLNHHRGGGVDQASLTAPMTPRGDDMPKKQLNIRVSDKTLKQIDELREEWGETQTGVVAQAIDRIYRDTIQLDRMMKIRHEEAPA